MLYLCHQDLCQVLLVLVTSFNYVYKLLGGLTTICHNVLEQVDLCVEDSQCDVKDSFSEELSSVI